MERNSSGPWRGALSTSVAFVAGAAASWAVGAALEAGVSAASDRGALAADVSSSGALGGDLVAATVNELQELQISRETPLDRLWRSFGGGPAGRTTITIDTYGSVSSPVIIRDARLVEIRCSEPDEELTYVAAERGGNYSGLALNFELNAGEETLEGREAPSYESFDSEEAITWTFPRQVSQAEGDQFVLDVAPAPDQLCTFEVEFAFSAEGSDGTLRVQNSDGRPFVVADPSVASERTTADEIYDD